MASPVIVLFRNDMRVADNKALVAAAGSGKPVVPLFILDEDAKDGRAAGAANRWWLHHSLLALDSAIADLGARLHVRVGPTEKILSEAIKSTGADTVFWNRRYAPGDIAVDKALKIALIDEGLKAESFDGFLLHDPSEVATQSGEFYKVFTPFHKRLSADHEPRDPVDRPQSLIGWSGSLRTEGITTLGLLPQRPDWSGGLSESWQPGEKGAHLRLETFLDHGLQTYARRRDLPGEGGTSGLSPHLAHGEITPYQLMAALQRRQGVGVETFRKELHWREFSYHLLFHFPLLHRQSFRPEFDRISWDAAPASLSAWKRGLTGFPIVDAGMRQLWQTGWMHNRVRMIVASFLIKDLLIDWKEGEAWFWDTLVDADAGNNAMNWQWVAGSGADAAPYFRIFNPVLQGEKFDPEGRYVRRYIPELDKMPNRYIHRPWDAPEAVLAEIGIAIGKDYPSPIVDHREARIRAMNAYKVVRKS